MRILRGKSSREVSSNGFALFVIGLVLSTFIGGAVRTLLSSEQVHQRVVNAMRERFPRHEFQLGQTEVLLSNGMWPGLVLKVKDLVLKQDVCGKLSFILQVPEAILPVDLWSLKAGPIRLQEVHIRDGHIHLDYRECSQRLEPGAALLASPPSSQSAQETTLEAPSLNWQILGQHLDGVLLKNFTVTYQRNLTWKLALHEADVVFGDDLRYRAVIDVHKSLPFGTLTHTVQIKGDGSGRVLNWDLHSEFKEGRIEWKGGWDLSTNVAQTRLTVRQIPVKDLMAELYQMGFLAQETNLKAAWLTSDVEWSGKMAHYADYPFKFNQLSFFGGYGRLDLVEPSLIKFKGADRFSELAIFKANQLQIHPISEAINVRILPAVISRLGLWTGVFKMQGLQNWSLDGFLENLEVVFSSASVRGKQLIRRIHTVASRNGSVVNGQVDEMQINDGQFFGFITINWDAIKKSGEAKAQIERLSLSPSIQSLLVGGELAPIKIQGEGRFIDQRLEEWTAQAEMAEAKGKGWLGRGLKVQSKSVGKDAAFDLEANQLQVQPGSKYLEQIKVLVPEFEEGLSWQNAKAQLRLGDSGGEILSLSATQEDLPLHWKGRGSWVRNGDLSAVVSFTGAGKSRSFVVHGRPSDFRIENYTRISR